MIGVIDCSIQAKFPNMPLEHMAAYVSSPSSIRVRNVPKRIGKWAIESVQFVAAYPDGSIKTANCVLTGGVWVGTIEGTQTSGTSQNGYTIFASGTDENGNAVTGYILGKGDITILNADGTLNPDAPSFYVHLFDEQPATPHEGDLYPTENGYVIFQGGQQVPLGITQSQMQSYVTQAISGKLDKSDYHGDYIIDANGNKIEADGDYIKTLPVQEDTVWHFSASFTSPSSSASASGDATYDSENHYWSYTDYYGISLQIYAVEVEGAIEGWRVVGSFTFLSPDGGSILKQFDFQMAGDKYTQSLHYDDNDGFTIDLTRDAITTCKLVTDIDLSAALELKQDKLSEDQISVIDHEVNDLYTHIQTVGGGNYTFKSPSTFNKSILIEQGILAEDGTTWIYPPVTVIMGSNVVVIDSGAFQNATNLLSFRGENVGLFQSNAFSGCTALKTVNIPNATVIGTWMFRYCTNLKTITMPKSVTTISRNAFADSSFDKVFFEGKTLAEVKAMTNYSRWGLAEDKIYTNAFENQLPTKTSELSNDSGFITATALNVKRDLTDFNVYGDPLSSGDMKFKFKAVGKNGTHQTTEGTMTIDPSNQTLTWVWTNGSARCSIEYTGEGYVFIYNYLSDGLNQFNGQFTMPIAEPKWSCDYADGVFDFTIVSSKGTIATQEWVLEQLSALEARIAALENQ